MISRLYSDQQIQPTADDDDASSRTPRHLFVGWLVAW